MLNNIINTMKNFLFVLMLFLILVMIFVKVRVYKIKRNIREIENKILALDKEMEVLNLELTYLSRPERLKQIYYVIKNVDNIDNNGMLKVEQIKDIKLLIPYYYAKVNNRESVAKND